jgi:dihydrofolate synthase/folylpolyglutamate synthase
MIAGLPPNKFGSGLALHRVLGIAGALGLDLGAFSARSIVIVGSNGKGSTAAMTASALAQALPGVGLFTSPHLFSPTERFQIDGIEISQEAMDRLGLLVAAAAEAWCAARPGEHLGGFEFMFLLAALWFKEQSASAIVWEAGIGGRYDCTRLVGAKLGALTSLDLEHTELLGDSLELIGCDKLDAFAAGAKVYLGPSCAPLEERLAAFAGLNGVELVQLEAGKDWRDTVRGAVGVDLPGFANAPMRPPLIGEHQKANAALAARLAFDFLRARFPGPRGEAEWLAKTIAQGLALTRWPGRLETLSEAPLIVIDVGHSPQATRAGRDGFATLSAGRSRILVCGASDNKDSVGMLATLVEGFDTIIATRAYHKGRPAAEISQLARQMAPDASVLEAATIEEAYALACAQAVAGEASVFVGGGLFLAIEFKAVHLALGPQTIRFF